jgi:hypothetical protein
MKDLHYQKLEMQSYMKNGSFNQEEIKLLFSLRSKSYPAKINYKKMNKGNLKCTFYCNSDETQEHIFQHCQPIQSRISYPVIVNLKDIYGSVDDQLSIIKNLTEVDRIRRLIIEDILPGGLARTHVST